MRFTPRQMMDIAMGLPAEPEHRVPGGILPYDLFFREFSRRPPYEQSWWIASLPYGQMKMKSNIGWSVAHELAWRGRLPRHLMRPEVLEIRDREGETVLWILARTGNLPEEFAREKSFLTRHVAPGRILAQVFLMEDVMPMDLLDSDVLSADTGGESVMETFVRRNLFRDLRSQAGTAAEKLDRIPEDSLRMIIEFLRNEKLTPPVSGEEETLFGTAESIAEEIYQNRLNSTVEMTPEDAGQIGAGDSLYDFAGGEGDPPDGERG